MVAMLFPLAGRVSCRDPCRPSRFGFRTPHVNKTFGVRVLSNFIQPTLGLAAGWPETVDHYYPDTD